MELVQATPADEAEKRPGHGDCARRSAAEEPSHFSADLAGISKDQVTDLLILAKAFRPFVAELFGQLVTIP
jgi:hypothetical protein